MRVLAVAKFVPGLSIVSIPMAGAMGTRYRTFLTYDSIGAALWSGTGLIVGALFARQIDMVFAAAGRLPSRGERHLPVHHRELDDELEQPVTVGQVRGCRHGEEHY